MELLSAPVDLLDDLSAAGGGRTVVITDCVVVKMSMPVDSFCFVDLAELGETLTGDTSCEETISGEVNSTELPYPVIFEMGGQRFISALMDSDKWESSRKLSGSVG